MPVKKTTTTAAKLMLASSHLKSRCTERSGTEQLILGETTCINLHCLSFFLSLPLTLRPHLETWVDEGFHFFEILSMELWTRLDFPGSSKNWRLSSESLKEASVFLQYEVDVDEDWFCQGRGNSSCVSRWCHVLWTSVDWKQWSSVSG